MNSFTINYNNDDDIKMYLNQILNEFDDFNKILCGSKYIKTNIQFVINELITKIDDKNTFVIIFKTFEILKKYIKCIDIEKFVLTSYKWNIHQFNFNLSEFIKSQLASQIKDIELINKIVDEYLHTLILNIEFAMNNFKLILKNISKSYLNSLDLKNSKLIINDSKYKLSFNTTNLNISQLTTKNKQELENKFKLIMSDIFYILRKLLATSSYHLNLINDNYERFLVKFITDHLPYQYYINIIDSMECIELYIKCIDLNKLINETEHMNMHAVSFDLKNNLLNILTSNSLDAKSNAFINSILNKLQNIFDCVNYILDNPRRILNNAKVFIELDKSDDIFSY